MAKKKQQPTKRSEEHGRRAHGTDPSIKAGNLRRLARIAGQVHGVRKMVENERYCADVLDQIAAIQSAMRAVAREVLRNHLKHCANAAMHGTPDEAECMQDELLKLFDKRMY